MSDNIKRLRIALSDTPFNVSLEINGFGEDFCREMKNSFVTFCDRFVEITDERKNEYVSNQEQKRSNQFESSSELSYNSEEKKNSNSTQYEVKQYSSAIVYENNFDMERIVNLINNDCCFLFEGSSGNRYYIYFPHSKNSDDVVINVDGLQKCYYPVCSCPSYRFGNRNRYKNYCKHLHFILNKMNINNIHWNSRPVNHYEILLDEDDEI